MIEWTLDSVRAFLGNEKIQFALLLPLQGLIFELNAILTTAYMNVTILFRNDLSRYFLNVYFNQPLLQLYRALYSLFSAFAALYRS